MRMAVFGSRGSKYPSGLTILKALEDPQQKELLFFDIENPVIIEEFDAVSWGHAMTYYQAKYWNTVYTNPDESVWDLW